MAKQTSGSARLAAEVRTRRAYFDCRFGQLHVRTAFPTTGGFDEGVTLVCLHPRDGSSSLFAGFLPRIAQQRSVYAPDLPGRGESDPAPSLDQEDAARAVADLAGDLRLRQIDVLGVGHGGAVAARLAASRPELVRRVVLVGSTGAGALPPLKQPVLLVEVAAADPLESEDFAARVAQFLEG